MAERLIRKLQNFVQLSREEKAALEALSRQRVVEYGPGDDVALEGEPPGPLNLILSGYAHRYKMLEDGRRQIVGLFIPGDLCDARMFIVKKRDHSIEATTRLHIAKLAPDEIVALTERSPRITRALWWNSIVEESIAREWIVNVGQRSAYERMAHLFCEFFVRMRSVGLVRGDRCEMPLTQSALADALGISAVHANRTLQALRTDGLLHHNGKTLEVLDLPQLMAAGLFSPDYLHLDQSGAALNAND